MMTSSMRYLWMPKMFVCSQIWVASQLGGASQNWWDLDSHRLCQICHSPMYTSFPFPLKTLDGSTLATYVIVCYTKTVHLLCSQCHSLCELLMLSPLHLGCGNSIVWFHSCGYLFHELNGRFQFQHITNIPFTPTCCEIYKALLVAKYRDNNSNHGYSTQLT